MLSSLRYLIVLSIFTSLAIFASCSKLADVKPGQPIVSAAKVGGETMSVKDARILLGKKIFNDVNLSISEGGQALMVQSCANCHLANQGFAGFGDKAVQIGDYTRRFVGGFAEGAVTGKFGNRLPPSAAYATYSPILNLPATVNGVQNIENEFFGGLFWDGRATGKTLGSPAAEQAMGPLLNPVEQNHPRPYDVLVKIEQNLNGYYDDVNLTTKTLWEVVWGNQLKVSTLQPTDPQVQVEYERLGRSIAAFEGSPEVNKFTSRYDEYLKGGAAVFNAKEIEGLNLFTLHCSGCHSLVNQVAGLPLLTDYGYDNIGVPPTNQHPLYANGTPPVDLGLGGFLETSGITEWMPFANGAKGKFKTPTLRNADKGELMLNGTVNRRYMHNGVFNSLEEVVHFYNTRTVRNAGWSKNPLPGQDPRSPKSANFVKWAKPEYPATFNGEIGNMGMTTPQELAVVAFLKTLTDR